MEKQVHKQETQLQEYKLTQERSITNTVNTILTQIGVFLLLLCVFIGLLMFAVYGISHPSELPKLAASFMTGMSLVLEVLKWAVMIALGTGALYLVARVLPFIGDVFIKCTHVLNAFMETIEKFLILIGKKPANRVHVIEEGYAITEGNLNFHPVRALRQPHVQVISEEGDEEEDEETLLLEAPRQNKPSIAEMINAVQENSYDLPLGRDITTGDIIIQNIVAEESHYKVLGTSGMGKSCEIAAILECLTQTHAPDKLMISLLDLEHKTSRLFENLSHVATLKIKGKIVDSVATDVQEVVKHLGYLYLEMKRREALDEYSLQKEIPIFIYIEEFLALLNETDEEEQKKVVKLFDVLTSRARKYRMYILFASQTNYVKKELQNAHRQFRTLLSFSSHPSSARASGFIDTDLLNQNFMRKEKGVFALEAPVHVGELIAPDYDVRQRLQVAAKRTSSGLYVPELPSSQIVQGGCEPSEPSYTFAPVNRLVNPVQDIQESSEPIVNHSGSSTVQLSLETIEAQGKVEQMRRLKSKGWNKEETITKVFQCTKGGSKAYKEGSRLYNAYVVSQEGSN